MNDFPVYQELIFNISDMNEFKDWVLLFRLSS